MVSPGGTRVRTRPPSVVQMALPAVGVVMREGISSINVAFAKSLRSAVVFACATAKTGGEHNNSQTLFQASEGYGKPARARCGAIARGSSFAAAGARYVFAQRKQRWKCRCRQVEAQTKA